ncbi:MAG: hypothetical protein R3223_10480, partial [Longimicrobiales bacterium]|nr:hypothetical protein [Longimicrobiales bacterium]
MRSRGPLSLLSGHLLPSGLLPPIASGLLLAVSFPPFHLLVPSFVALVPLALHLRALPGGPVGSGQAFRAGTVTGILYFGLLLHWLVPALLWLNPVGPLLYLVVMILLGGLLGIAAWATHRLVHEAGVPFVIALPLAWVAVEWLRGHLPGGLAFPWLGLGTSLTAYPEVVGIAELVGSRGVSLWLVLGGSLLAEAVWRAAAATGRDRIRRWAGAEGSTGGAPATGAPASRRPATGGPGSAVGILGVAAVVLAGPPTWGVWRAATLPVHPVARVGLVQTQVSAEAKGDPTRALEATRQQLRELGFGDGAGSLGDPELLVWPETTFPFPVSSRSDAVRNLVESASAEEDAPLLFGALESAGDSPGAEYNAAFL